MKISKLLLVSQAMLFAGFLQAQQTSLAIINISVRGMIYDQAMVTNMVRKELLKTNLYYVIDPYEVSEKMKNAGADYAGSYDRESLSAAAALMGAKKILTGSMERLGDRMIVTLSIVDAGSKTIEKSFTGEYIYNTDYADNIVGVAVKNLLDIPVDQQILDAVVARKEPVVNLYNTVRASGPRIGLTHFTGYLKRRLTDPEAPDNGFDMNPVISQFGYQFESQYYSSGYMQTLIEVVVLLGGIENGRFIPTLAVLNGFRDAKSGLEIALGPVFWLSQKEEGTYIDGKWKLKKDLLNDTTLTVDPDEEYYVLPHKGGTTSPGFGLVVSVGKTFRSGNLNIPVNIYMIPQQHRKEGWQWGISLGFNVSKK